MHKNKINNIFVGFIFLFFSDYFSYTNLNSEVHALLTQVGVSLLILYLLIHRKKIQQKSVKHESARFVLIICIIAIFTAVPCYITYGQSFYQSLAQSKLLSNLVLLVYFFLVLKEVDTRFLIRFLVICALARTGITLIEQFTYPNAPFTYIHGNYDEFGRWNDIGSRSGIYRFLIADAVYLPLFGAFYYYDKLTKSMSPKYVLAFFVMLLGMFLDQSRQIMGTFILSIIIGSLLNSNKKILALFIFASVLVLILSNSLFDDLYTATAEDLDNEDYTRFLEYAYFSKFDNVITAFFGHGFPGGNSAYAALVESDHDMWFFTEDVGIVGAMYRLGYLFILVFLFYVAKVLRNWSRFDLYLKLIKLCLIIDSQMIFLLFNFTVPCCEVFMAIIIYLIDSNIYKIKVCENKVP